MSDPDPAPASRDAEIAWHRLHSRMLLVHPVREILKYLPILLVALVAGSVGGEPWWTYALSGLGLTIGLMRWFTTSYRITPTHVEVRRGLLSRRTLSVPRERIRSVDVDATLLHRLVGLAVVKVGTSASHGQDGLDFDGVAAADIPPLRAELLRGVAPSAEDVTVPGRPVHADFSGWRWSWARYAPFTFTGVGSLLVAAFFALQLQFFDGGLLLRVPWVRSAMAALTHVPPTALIGWGALILVVAASLIALVRYVLAFGGFSIWRSDAATLHVSHGLLRTRQITLDERRLRGIHLNEPLSLRAVHAASAHAIMTGLGRDRGGIMIVEPPGPYDEAERVAAAVLGDATPLHEPLIGHGPRAHRRRYTRAATGVGVLAAVALTGQLAGLVSPLIWTAFLVIVLVAAGLAEDRWRGLGHALLPGRLISRSGSLLRKRVVLDTDGIIGWTVRRSLFQRRAGLATLIATTAAGRHRYSVPDVPIEEAWRLVEAISLRQADPAVVSPR